MALIIQRPQVAYVRKKGSSEYEIDRSTGKLLQVDIEKAIRVKLDDPDRHKAIQYWSLNPDPPKRYRLKVHTVNQQFERYKKGSTDREFDRSPLEFDFESVRKEPFLHLPNNSKYYPDVLCTFSEEHEMYDRWGGKIAIEVTYTHGCESYKLEDFIFHNIPVFEVTIEEGSARQFPAERPNWPKGKPWGHQLVESHINDLLKWFAKGIVGQLKVDPVSTRIYDKDLTLWLGKEEILEQKISALEDDIKVFRSEAASLAIRFKESLNSLASAKNKIEKIDSINESLRMNNAKLSLSLRTESERSKAKVVDLNNNVDSLNVGLDMLRRRLELKGFFVYILVAIIIGTLLMPLFFPDLSRELLNSWYGGMLKFRSIFD